MDILATVILPYTTGLPDDVAINTFAFRADDETAATTEIPPLLVSLYNDTVTGGGSNRISRLLSEVIDRSTNVCDIVLAEIVDPGPTVDVGPAFSITPFTLGSLSGGGTPVSLPLEVAVCASFYDTIDTATPIRRRRGRVYLGPLDIAVLDQTGPYPLVSSGTGGATTMIGEAFERLAEDSAAAGVDWCVWSRTGGFLTGIDSGFVNNEFDTQRRRGAEATLRFSWTTLV